MVKINLPEQILEKEAFKSLPAKEKEEYVGNLLKKILELNPDGVTISQIREVSDLTYSTIWHHLEVLKCTSQGHKISRGNLDVYYPPGKVIRLNEYSKGKVFYDFGTVENDEGNFLYIYEKRENRLGNKTICRGIALPVELIDDIVEDLKKGKSSFTN